MRSVLAEPIDSLEVIVVDDDVVVAGGLTAMVHALEANPDVGVAIGQVHCTGPDEAHRRRLEAWFDESARSAPTDT